MSRERKKPSEVSEEGKEWLLCGLEECRDRLSEYIEKNDVSDPKSMDDDDLDGYKDPKVEKIDRRAVDDAYLSGNGRSLFFQKK